MNCFSKNPNVSNDGEKSDKEKERKEGKKRRKERKGINIAIWLI